MNDGVEAQNIVTIGGGTGTFVVLSGLRPLEHVSLTAIVSSADDGGSTGRLRDAYGILPPGDARQALVALSEEDTLLRRLFSYRFSKGDVYGHNLGNLFITALADILGSDAAAIEEAARILRIKGRVLSVSERPTHLEAKLSDGTLLKGEHAIDARVPGRSAIQEVFLSEVLPISSSARQAIIEAQLIVLGPGDLYTSTIAALLPSGIPEAIQTTNARLVYVLNLFTKAGQTEGLSASKHVAEIERYLGRNLDTIFIHGQSLPDDAVARYAKEGETPVEDDLGTDPRVRRLDLVSISMVPSVPEDPVPRSLIRHDSTKLASALVTLL